MTTDFNPSNHEQPDFGKDEARSARAGFAILLTGLLTIGQSVQVFSRIPGTSGPLFILAHLFGMLAQVAFYEVCVEANGRDLIGIAVPIGLQIVWLICGIVSAFRLRQRGFETELNQLGVGILYRQMANQSAAAIGFTSDMLVSVGFTTICFLCQSPILARWYLVVTLGLLFTHLWMDWRQRTEMNRLNNARSRARHWTNRLNQTNRR